MTILFTDVFIYNGYPYYNVVVVVVAAAAAAVVAVVVILIIIVIMIVLVVEWGQFSPIWLFNMYNVNVSVTTRDIVISSSWPHFYQTRSAWSKDQGSNENHFPVHNFAPTVNKFCVVWEGQALPQDTKFGNCRDKIVDNRACLSWSLILGSSWSGLIKLGPGGQHDTTT